MKTLEENWEKIETVYLELEQATKGWEKVWKDKKTGEKSERMGRERKWKEVGEKIITTENYLNVSLEFKWMRRLV